MKTSDCVWTFFGVKSVVLIFLFLVSHSSFAQTGCSCPPLNTCFTCSGGLTYIKLKYTNSDIIISMTASDNGGALSSTFQNSMITINSRAAGQPFDGDVTISITKFNGNQSDVNVSSSCASPLFVGDHIQNFEVVEGASVAGPICCSNSQMDHVRPTIAACPADVSISAAPGGCIGSATWTPPTATDNCGNVALTSTHQPGSSFPLGTTVVTYTATDDFDNSRSCSFNVIVTENNPPLISNCPSDISVSTAGSSCNAIANWNEPTASDCDLSSFTSNITPGSVFQIGTTPVIYTATDLAGNTITCSFSVTVTDGIPPVFVTCPASIELIADQSCGAVASWTAPTTNDACTAATLTSTAQPGDTFPVGKTSVVYTATDAAGNKTTCSFDVTVKDTTAPVFASCPASLNIVTGQSCNAIANWIAPTVTDNCTGITLLSSAKPGDAFSLGTTSVTYTATDAAGNTASCSFSITVKDATPPVFNTCPITINLTANTSCNAVAEWVVPVATDNCSTSVTITSSAKPGDSFSVGTTTVTYTAIDASGNSSQCQFEVVVSETNSSFTDCPSDITIQADESGQAVVTWTAPKVTGSCGNNPVTSTHLPGDTFAAGTTVVTYTLSGKTGSGSSCQFNVIVSPIDTEVEFDVIAVVTPDGDGINDSWQLPNIERFTNNKVILLDRWGGLIYEASGYNNGSVSWSGSNTKGNQVPSGTYFYSIIVHHESGEIKKKGFIELIR